MSGARVTCTCTQHRCVTCLNVDKAQHLASGAGPMLPGPVDLWFAYGHADAWGAQVGMYNIRGAGDPPAKLPTHEPWSLVATVAEDGAVTWGAGWHP